MQAWLIISLQFCTFWYSLIHGWHILLHICYTLLAESFSAVVYRAIIWLTTAVAPPVRPSGRLESPIWRATRNLVPDKSEILCFLQLWGGWVSVQSVNLNWLDWKPTGREREKHEHLYLDIGSTQIVHIHHNSADSKSQKENFSVKKNI